MQILPTMLSCASRTHALKLCTGISLIVFALVAACTPPPPNTAEPAATRPPSALLSASSSTPAVTPAAAATATALPEPTATAVPTATPTVSATPTPSATATPLPTATPVPPTNTPVPPTPTNTPVPQPAYSTTGVNVREGPGTEYKVLTTLPVHAQVTIIGSSGEWSQLRVHSTNLVGWSISEAFAAGIAPTPTPTPRATPTFTPRPPTPTKTAAQPEEPAPAPSGTARVISVGNRSRPIVALTFDAGAGSAPTPKILEALRKHNVRVTMFVTGKWAEENPGLMRQMAADGHEFANHTWTHDDQTKKSDAAVIEEVRSTEQIILSMTGQNPKPYFRPPYGAYNGRLVNIWGSLGYYTIMWTLDSGDWLADATPAKVLNKVATQSGNGSIVVQHLGSQQTADSLDELITRLKARGFTIGTLSDALR